MKKIFKKPRQNQAKKIADICIWMSDPVKFNEMQDGFIKNKNTFIQVEASLCKQHSLLCLFFLKSFGSMFHFLHLCHFCIIKQKI